MTGPPSPTPLTGARGQSYEVGPSGAAGPGKCPDALNVADCVGRSRDSGPPGPSHTYRGGTITSGVSHGSRKENARAMTTVVIAAHNEGAVIDQCLLALRTPGHEPLDIVVAANGCSDDTAERARRHGVVVLELPNPGKAAALNAAARFVLGYPVVYLDADIRLTAADVERLVGVLGGASGRSCSTMAAAPSRDVDARQSTGLVRAYHRVLDSHPAYGHALFGRGAIALSELGRARFDAFPDVLADDFFLDSLFAPEEKVVVEDVASVVHAPRDTRALVRRLARVRRGNRQLRRSTDSARPVEGLGWLVTVVRQRPSMGPAAVAYLAITAAAELVAEWGPRSWGHDRSRGSLFEMRDPI